MPQIAQLAETYSSQIFWLLLIFGALFFIVGRGMVPKVVDTVSQRDTQIASDLAAAQAAREQADREEEAWRLRENASRANAQALVAEAKAEAGRRNETRLSEAQTRFDAQLADADARIGASRDQALSEIETVAAEAAQDIVHRLAGVQVPAAQAQAAVKEAMHHG
ncbi:F0F1 ATP synthase subunit B family protein [Qipengyuania sp. YIM B01966]|uniref:F0F1 ATP synthase subunit B family protein n=1 Tax=Qipengyuania sp. YIM B01966 TaxID=2778646 RepID=UPI0018F42CCB|nr:ATPase [Qipengyuania sp. YIM B01966]